MSHIYKLGESDKSMTSIRLMMLGWLMSFMTAISRFTAFSTDALAAKCDLAMILMATFSPVTLWMPILTRPARTLLVKGNPSWHGLCCTWWSSAQCLAQPVIADVFSASVSRGHHRRVVFAMWVFGYDPPLWSRRCNGVYHCHGSKM